MSKEYVIMTDSSCDLPQELADQLGLEVLPLEVMADGKNYRNWLDGREIGSYVIPECENKFYVTASVDERARRRLLELKEKGGDNGMTVEDMAKDIAERDYNDSHRAFAPLLRLPEAILIDTTDLTIDEAVNAVLKNLKNIGAEAHK